MDISNLSIVAGIISFCILLYFIIFRQKNIDRNDIGGLAAIYTAGVNLPKAFFLTFYSIIPAYKEELSATHLAGYENYISMSGLILLGLCAVTYWAVLKPYLKKNE